MSSWYTVRFQLEGQQAVTRHFQKVVVVRGDDCVSVLDVALQTEEGVDAVDVYNTLLEADPDLSWESYIKSWVLECINNITSTWEPEWLPIKSWRLALPEEIPASRAYRNAWRCNGEGVVACDMAVAREMKKSELRFVRERPLAELDVQFMKALERIMGEHPELAPIIARKQQLRDVTKDPRIEAAQTADELLAVDPLSEVGVADDGLVVQPARLDVTRTS
jgi:hypothetical protein